MILDAKQTTVAYRCPSCGAGVLSAVNLFSLGADMIKLKCDCKQSEMTVSPTADGKIRLTVPCMVCPSPHIFTVSKTLFYSKELFTMQCPYVSDLTIALFGEINLVRAELARGELALMDLMEKNGIESFDLLHNDEEALPDPQILDIVMFVINDMDAEGKIYCHCETGDNDRHYDAEITEAGVKVTCKKCGASRLIPTDSRISAHAFLNADALYLE
ncbi:MAG: hypothetical protein E7643_03935 [Ruminococcaceae bacterium]|nr:hypothetical protein [Oscillospiraceae bacterium]